MINKTALKKHIEKFPEEFTTDELIEKIIFIEKLEKRIECPQLPIIYKN